MMKKCYLIFIFFLLPFLLNAQEIELKGTIYKMATSEPVKGVRVSVPRLGLETVTDSLGVFSLKADFGERVELLFTHPSYEVFNKDVMLISGIINDYMIYLKPINYIKLPVTEIHDTYQTAKPFATDIIFAKQFEETPVRDLGDYLRSVPNVGGVRKGGANIDPVVRGFKYSQLNVVINGAQGVEGGCPNRMDPATSRIDAEDLERIEIYKGPYALRYGASLGGTINLVASRPYPYDNPTINVKGMRTYESNWGGHKEHLSIMGGNKNAFFLVSGNRWDYGNYADGNGNIIKSNFSKQNYSAKIGGNYKNKYDFIFGITQSHHNVMFPALPMDETNDKSTLTYSEYSYIPAKALLKKITLKGYISDVHHIMDNKNRPTSDTVVAISDVLAATFGGKAEADLNIYNGILLIGVDYQRREKAGSRFKHMIMQPLAPVKTEALWLAASIENTAAYFEYSKKIKSWDIILASRFDNNHGSSGPIKLMGSPNQVLLDNSNTSSLHHNFSYSGGLTKNFSDDLSLGIALGSATRSPDMLERFIILLPVGFDFYDYLGNPQLKPETNYQADLIFNYNHKLIGGFNLNLFTSYVKNFIYGQIVPPSQQLPLTQFVKGVKRFENGPDVNLSGFEVAYSTPELYSLNIHLTAAFTYATVSESTLHIKTDTENYQVTIKNDALNEIPPLELNLNVSYPFFNKKLKPVVSFRYVAAQNHVSEAFNEKATPSFLLANCALNYKFNSYLSFNTGVHNILDVAYYEHLNRRTLNTIDKLYEPGRVIYGNIIFKF